VYIGLGERSMGWCEVGQPAGRDFQMHGRSFEIPRLQQRDPDFVVRPSGVGLKFNRFVQMLGSFGVLGFLG
jgi:hypothetical protein